MPCIQIQVQGKPVICPDWLPRVGWSFNHGGYVIYTSRKKNDMIKRGEAMARIIARVLCGVSGHQWNPDVQVHHTDGQRNNCPAKLIQMHPALHVKESARCPYTGKFMTVAEYRRRLGV